jgi:hypothetical protein
MAIAVVLLPFHDAPATCPDLAGIAPRRRWPLRLAGCLLALLLAGGVLTRTRAGAAVVERIRHPPPSAPSEVTLTPA